MWHRSRRRVFDTVVMASNVMIFLGVRHRGRGAGQHGLPPGLGRRGRGWLQFGRLALALVSFDQMAAEAGAGS